MVRASHPPPSPPPSLSPALPAHCSHTIPPATRPTKARTPHRVLPGSGGLRQKRGARFGPSSRAAPTAAISARSAALPFGFVSPFPPPWCAALSLRAPHSRRPGTLVRRRCHRRHCRRRSGSGLYHGGDYYPTHSGPVSPDHPRPHPGRHLRHHDRHPRLLQSRHSCSARDTAARLVSARTSTARFRHRRRPERGFVRFRHPECHRAVGPARRVEVISLHHVGRDLVDDRFAAAHTSPQWPPPSGALDAASCRALRRRRRGWRWGS